MTCNHLPPSNAALCNQTCFAAANPLCFPTPHPRERKEKKNLWRHRNDATAFPTMMEAQSAETFLTQPCRNHQEMGFIDHCIASFFLDLHASHCRIDFRWNACKSHTRPHDMRTLRASLLHVLCSSLGKEHLRRYSWGRGINWIKYSTRKKVAMNNWDERLCRRDSPRSFFVLRCIKTSSIRQSQQKQIQPQSPLPQSLAESIVNKKPRSFSQHVIFIFPSRTHTLKSVLSFLSRFSTFLPHSRRPTWKPSLKTFPAHTEFS